MGTANLIPSVMPCLIHDANVVLTALRNSALSKPVLAFEMDCTSYLSGDANKKLRQAIMYVCTGEYLPYSKCLFSHVCDYIKANHLQTKLF